MNIVQKNGGDCGGSRSGGGSGGGGSSDYDMMMIMIMVVVVVIMMMMIFKCAWRLSDKEIIKGAWSNPNPCVTLRCAIIS